MTPTRRHALHAAGATGLHALFASLGLLPGHAAAQTSAATRAILEARSVAEALTALGATGASDSRQIAITAPEIAENGAVVPISVRSALPRTSLIAVLVDKNPNPFAASFEILEGLEPDIGMRLKLSQSSDVIALVRADGRLWTSRREVKVTLGGCGA